jgi:hypothetical protein
MPMRESECEIVKPVAIQRSPVFGLSSLFAFCGAATGAIYITTRPPGLSSELGMGLLVGAAIVFCCGSILSLSFAVFGIVRKETPRWPSITGIALSVVPAIAGVWIVVYLESRFQFWSGVISGYWHRF